MAYLYALTRKNRVYNIPLKADDISDNELLHITRFPRAAVDELCDMLYDDLHRATDRSHSIPVECQVMTALQFFASGSFQWMVGRSSFLSQSSTSRIIDDVARALCKLAPVYIKFSADQNKLMESKIAFNAIAGFPNVIGAIDCTHIAIKSPTQHEDAYVNRKGVHTVNIQAVCDNDMQLLNIVARWPGSTHDSFIWRDSALHRLFENGQIQGGWLIGDSGYPLEPWLLTPVNNPTTRSETGYNLAHAKTRCIIERCFGVMKSRFRCLDKSGGTLLYKPEKACTIFTAVAVLHNYCIRRRITTVIDPLVIARNAAIQPPQVQQQTQPAAVRSAVELRRTVIQQF